MKLIDFITLNELIVVEDNAKMKYFNLLQF